MPSQSALWLRVQTAKQNVNATLGRELDYAFRSSNTYQSYTGLCGEAQMAQEDEELTEELVQLLETYAHNVIGLWRETHPQ
jgi:hypothetical protein